MRFALFILALGFAGTASAQDCDALNVAVAGSSFAEALLLDNLNALGMNAVDIGSDCSAGALDGYDVFIAHGNPDCSYDDVDSWVDAGGGVIGTPHIVNNGHSGAIAAMPVGESNHGSTNDTTDMTITMETYLTDGVSFGGESSGREHANELKDGATQFLSHNQHDDSVAGAFWDYGAGRGVYLDFQYYTNDYDTVNGYEWGARLMENAVRYAAHCDAPAGPTVTVTGEECPGRIDVDISGLTPGGSAVLVASRSLADEGTLGVTLPRVAGDCFGLPTYMDGPVSYKRLLDHDGDGVMNMSPDVPDGGCGKWFSVLDVETCAITAPVQMTKPARVLYGAVGQCSGSGLSVLDVDTGVSETVCDLANGYSGLTMSDDGRLFGITDVCTGSGLYEIDPVACTETPLYDPGYRETGLGYLDGLLYMVDTSTYTSTYDLATGEVTDLGFSSVNCCGGDIASDADGVMWYADGGFSSGTIDMASGSKTWQFDGNFNNGITFYNGQLIGLAGRDGASIWSYDPVTGDATDMGMHFNLSDIDAIAGTP